MNNQPPDSMVPPVIAGRYRIQELLSANSLAEAYCAEDLVGGSPVTLVVLPAQGTLPASRFHLACQHAARWRHPSLPTVASIGKEGVREYLVLDETPPLTLRQLVHESGGVSATRAVDVSLQACALLSSLRRQGAPVPSLDLQALRLDPKGNLRLDPLAWLSVLAEPAACSTDADDVPAVGRLFSRLLTGESTEGPLLGTGGISPALEFILTKALNERADERYSSLDALDESLRAYWVPRWGRLPDRPAFRATETEGAPSGSDPGSRQEQGDSRPIPTALPPGAPPASHQPSKRASDSFAGWLFVIAAAAVVGLIPLWATVYLRYAHPPARIPTPAPTATMVVQVVIPDVTGLEERVAYDLLDRKGLRMAVVGQDYSDAMPLGRILSQSPSAEAAVDPGATVEVVLSRGSAGVPVPDVVGQMLSAAEVKLAEASLNASRLDKWSDQPVGVVLSQSPAAGTLVAPGSGVVLDVSSGKEIAVGGRFGDLARLIGVELSAIQVKPGDTLRVTLRWQALTTAQQRYSIFFHLAGANGLVVAQNDSEPRGGERPTTDWRAGDVIIEDRQVVVPGETTPGAYTIRVGIYAPPAGPRLPVTDAGRAQTVDNALIVATVSVVR